MSTVFSNHVSWQKRLARLYARYRLKKAFSDLRLLGSSRLEDAISQGPLIIASNHVAYWDAFLLVILEQHFRARAHCLMDAENLKQFAFFRHLGALPLDRVKPKQGLRDMHHSLSKLKTCGDLLFIFPGGRQQPAHLPLDFQQGVAYLAQQSNLPVMPLGLRYDYREGPRPVVHVAAGEPLFFEAASSRQQFTETVAGAVAECLKRIDQALAPNVSEGVSLLGRAHRIDVSERRPALSQALNRLTGGER